MRDECYRSRPFVPEPVLIANVFGRVSRFSSLSSLMRSYRRRASDSSMCASSSRWAEVSSPSRCRASIALRSFWQSASIWTTNQFKCSRASKIEVLSIKSRYGRGQETVSYPEPGFRLARIDKSRRAPAYRVRGCSCISRDLERETVPGFGVSARLGDSETQLISANTELAWHHVAKKACFSGRDERI